MVQSRVGSVNAHDLTLPPTSGTLCNPPAADAAMPHSNRSARLDALLKSGRLSRRDLLGTMAGLGLSGALGAMLPARALAQAAHRFVGYPFALGVASGYPRADGFTLWTRLAPAPLQADGGIERDAMIAVDWQVAEDESFGKVVAEGRVRAVHELAYSVHVDVIGLRPDRAYFYRFIAGDAVSPTGRSRSAPAADASPRALKFAFGSCQHYEQGHFDSYRQLVADGPDLMIFLGDYIYESSWGDELVRRHMGGEPYTLEEYRVRHAQYKTDPGLQAAHAALPWLVTWDDHEVDNDPAVDEAEHLDPRFLLRRAAAYQAYYEHMPLPRAMRPRVDGSLPLYTSVDYGQLARFFVLDLRQYRSAMACPDPFKGGGSTTLDPAACADLEAPGRSLLGPEQERWLKSGLEQSSARWNVIAQQTQLSPMDQQGGAGKRIWTDGWDGYPASQRALIEALGNPQLLNPLVIGGDIHANVVANVVANVQADPWGEARTVAAEICGTSISSQGWPQERYDATLPDNPHVLYGRSDRRGYALVEIGRNAEVALRSPQTVKTPSSPVETVARFVVEGGVRGIRRA
jgi:alkaline phosphatase D